MNTEPTFESRFASRQSLGARAFLLTIPIGVVAALTATKAPFASLQVFCEWLVTGALAQAALGLGLYIGWRVTRAVDGADLRLRVIGFTLVAGAMRGAVIAVLPLLWNLPVTTAPAARIASSSLVFSVWLLFIGAALEENDRYRGQVSHLLDGLIARELQVRERSHERSRSTTAMQRIAEAASSASAVLDAAPGERDYGHVARQVRDIVEQRLRPLSHELWATSTPALDYERAAGAFLLRVLRNAPPYRTAIPLMSMLLIVNSVMWHGWFPGVAVGGAAAGTASVIVLIGSRPRHGRSAIRRHLVMYGALLVLPVWASIAVLREFTHHTVPAVVATVMAVGIPVAFGLGAATKTLLEDRRTVLAELRARIDDDTWNFHVDAAAERSANVDAAAFLHNRLQARLTAVAIQLEQAALEHDVQRAEVAVAAAREVLDEVTGARSDGETPLGRLQSMAQAWHGIAEVHLLVEPSHLDAVDALAVTEAVEEAVANAVRHGQASKVTVRTQPVLDGIEVTVDDNGVDTPAAPGQGIGLRRLGALTQEPPELTRLADGTRLRMRFGS